MASIEHEQTQKKATFFCHVVKGKLFVEVQKSNLRSRVESFIELELGTRNLIYGCNYMSE